MKVFRKENVILRTNNPFKEKELLSRGFKEVKPKSSRKKEESPSKEG